MSILIDTNFLLAMTFPKDSNYWKAHEAMRDLKEKRVIVAPVLPEVFFMIASRMNYSAAVRFFKMLQSAAFQIEPLTTEDMIRMSEIMAVYEDNAFDFVDVSIMALSERLNITDVYTFDRRDFTVFRPKHCVSLLLFP